MSVDENTAQAFDAKPLNEAHPTHVRGEIVDLHCTFADTVAIGLVADIQRNVLNLRHGQIPLVQRLLVHGPNASETFVLEIKREIAANETSAARDHDQVIFL